MAGATEETVNELIVAAGVDRGGAAKEFCERAEVTAPATASRSQTSRDSFDQDFAGRRQRIAGD
jgi:hypothetical protein